MTVQFHEAFLRHRKVQGSGITLDGEHDNGMFKQCVRNIEYLTQEISEMEEAHTQDDIAERIRKDSDEHD